MSLKRKTQRKSTRSMPIKEEFIDETYVKVENDCMPSLPLQAITRIEYQPEIRRRKENGSFTPLAARCTKNLVKNYGKAICNFASSKLSLPYLDPILAKENVLRESFVEYVTDKKGTIEGIESFRILFIVTNEDSEAEQAFKRILKQIGIIFIKYFSVNWIFSSKITHKDAHLKFRYKMIRRINNPELFTYLRSFRKEA